MPRVGTDSDEDHESKPGPRTRRALAAAVSVTPTRRSTRIRHGSVNPDGSSPESIADSGTSSSKINLRKRAVAVDLPKAVNKRRNSLSSNVSEQTDADFTPGTPKTRATRRSIAVVTPVERPKPVTRTRRTTKTSETESSPPAPRVTRRTRANSVDPERESKNATTTAHVNTPTKTRRGRASAIPTEPVVAEEVEEAKTSRAMAKVTEISEEEMDVDEKTDQISPRLSRTSSKTGTKLSQASELSSFDRSSENKSPNKSVKNSDLDMEVDDESDDAATMSPRKSLKDSLSKSTLSVDDNSGKQASVMLVNLSGSFESSVKRGSKDFSANDTEFENTRPKPRKSLGKSKSPIVDKSKEVGAKIEDLLNRSIEEQRKSPGNKENEKTNVSPEKVKKNLDFTVATTHIASRKSLGSITPIDEYAARRLNKSLDEQVLSKTKLHKAFTKSIDNDDLTSIKSTKTPDKKSTRRSTTADTTLEMKHESSDDAVVTKSGNTNEISDDVKELAMENEITDEFKLYDSANSEDDQDVESKGERHSGQANVSNVVDASFVTETKRRRSSLTKSKVIESEVSSETQVEKQDGSFAGSEDETWDSIHVDAKEENLNKSKDWKLKKISLSLERIDKSGSVQDDIAGDRSVDEESQVEKSKPRISQTNNKNEAMETDDHNLSTQDESETMAEPVSQNDSISSTEQPAEEPATTTIDRKSVGKNKSESPNRKGSKDTVGTHVSDGDSDEFLENLFQDIPADEWNSKYEKNSRKETRSSLLLTTSDNNSSTEASPTQRSQAPSEESENLVVPTERTKETSRRYSETLQNTLAEFTNSLNSSDKDSRAASKTIGGKTPDKSSETPGKPKTPKSITSEKKKSPVKSAKLTPKSNIVRDNQDSVDSDTSDDITTPGPKSKVEIPKMVSLNKKNQHSTPKNENYSTLAIVDSESESDDVSDDDTPSPKSGTKMVPSFLFNVNTSESSDSDDNNSDNTIDSDVAKEMNLDGNTSITYSDDDVAGDDCRASESEHSDEDDDGSDLINFIDDREIDSSAESDSSEQTEDQVTTGAKTFKRISQASSSDEEENNVVEIFDEDDEEVEEQDSSKTPRHLSETNKSLQSQDRSNKSNRSVKSNRSSTDKSDKGWKISVETSSRTPNASTVTPKLFKSDKKQRGPLDVVKDLDTTIDLLTPEPDAAKVKSKAIIPLAKTSKESTPTNKVLKKLEESFETLNKTIDLGTPEQDSSNSTNDRVDDVGSSPQLNISTNAADRRKSRKSSSRDESRTLDESMGVATTAITPGTESKKVSKQKTPKSATELHNDSSHLFTVPAFKTPPMASTLNRRSMLTPNSETPQTKFLKKEKLNESLPLLELNKRRKTSIRESVLCDMNEDEGEEHESAEEEPEEVIQDAGDDDSEDDGADNEDEGVNGNGDHKDDDDDDEEDDRPDNKIGKDEEEAEDENEMEDENESNEQSVTAANTSRTSEKSLSESRTKSEKRSAKKKRKLELKKLRDLEKDQSSAKRDGKRKADELSKDEMDVSVVENGSMSKRKEKSVSKIPNGNDKSRVDSETDSTVARKNKKMKKASIVSTSEVDEDIPTIITPQTKAESDSDDAPESLGFGKAREQVTAAMKHLATNLKSSSEAKKKKRRDQLERIKQEKEAKSRKLKQEGKTKMNPGSATLKRLPEDVLDSLSDVPQQAQKKRKLLKGEQKILPSRSMFSPDKLSTARVKVESQRSPVSSCGGTTQFEIVSIEKVKKKPKKAAAVASFRDLMLARNPRQAASAYQVYQAKQTASGKNVFGRRKF